MNYFSERRKTQRIPVQIPAGVYLPDRPYEVIDAEILSISEGGAFVHCSAPIGLGREVLIEIRFAETKLIEAKVVEQGAEVLEDEAPAKSVVKWAKGNPTEMVGFGVEFVGLKADKRKFLSKIVAHFQSINEAAAAVPAKPKPLL